MAEKIINRAFRVLSDDTQGLTSHSLRKSWALRSTPRAATTSLSLRDGLGQRSVAVTQVYLPTACAPSNLCSSKPTGPAATLVAPNPPRQWWSPFSPDGTCSRKHEFPQFGKRENSRPTQSPLGEH